MRLDTSRVRWALATGLASLYLLWALARPNLLYDPQRAVVPYTAARLILFVYTLLFLRLALTTLARFQGTAAKNPHDSATQRYGVWAWGLPFATFMSAMSAARMSGPFSASWHSVERLLFHFIFVFAIALPISLWGGYL